MNRPLSNFSHLAPHDERLAKLGALAEHYFPGDPNTCLIKLRQFAKLLAQEVAPRFGSFASMTETQQDLLRRLGARGVIGRAVTDLFHGIRNAGYDDTRSPENVLAAGRLVASHVGDHCSTSGLFIWPKPPADESEWLHATKQSFAL